MAVFADPFSVSLHATTWHPPSPGGRVLVYGVGSLGLRALAILRALYPGVAVVARFDAQAELARRFGAAEVLAHEPRLAVIEELSAWGGGRCINRCRACRWPTRGGRRRVRHHRQARDVRVRGAAVACGERW
nr:hypothetical protein [Mycobacterium tilburgii]